MVIRHIILAGLMAATSAAQASAPEGKVVAGYTTVKGSVNVVGELDYMQMMLAKANSEVEYDLHTVLAGRDGNTAQLFTMNTKNTAPRLSYAAVSTQTDVPAGVPLFAQAAGAGAIAGGGASVQPAGADAGKPSGAASSGSSASQSGSASPAGGASQSGTQQLITELRANAGTQQVGPVLQADAINDVPEPSSNMLMLAGLMAGAVLVRRRSM